MSFRARVSFVLFLLLPLWNSVAFAGVIFRPAKPADKRIIEVLVRDPSFIEYYGGGRPTDPDQLYISLKKFEDKGGNFVIADRESERMLGVGHISKSVTFDHRWEISYAILPVQRGQGFGREAIRQMLKNILTRDPQAAVIARVAGLNKISQYLLESEGFVPIESFDRAKFPRRYIHYMYTPNCEGLSQ